MFLFYIIEFTPGILTFYGAKPMLVLPACILIAVYEGEYTGGIFGFAAGLFCDSCGTGVFGFSALTFMALSVAAGLLTRGFLRRSYINISVLCEFGVFLHALVRFYFRYSLYGFEGLNKFFYVDIMPGVVYSGIFILLFCLAADKIHYYFEPLEIRE